MFIYLLIQYFKEFFYILEKDFSNSVLHSSIGNDLTLVLRGFVVGNQIFNLTFGPFFYHNSCISS